MMQAVDRSGAADFLGISVATLTRRIKTNRFPLADEHGSLNTEETDWWTLQTLEKYKRAEARRRHRK